MQRVHPGAARRLACGISQPQSSHSAKDSAPPRFSAAAMAVSRWKASSSWARSKSSISDLLQCGVGIELGFQFIAPAAVVDSVGDQVGRWYPGAGGGGLTGFCSISGVGCGQTRITLGVAKRGAVDAQAVRAKTSPSLAIIASCICDPFAELGLALRQLALGLQQLPAQLVGLLGELPLVGQRGGQVIPGN